MKQPVRAVSRCQKGVTLLEAIVVLMVVAVLTGAALPSFAGWIGQHELAMAANDLVAAARLARSEALSRRGRVAVAPLTPRDWNSGWDVFVDANNNGVRESGEEVLVRFAPPPPSVRISPYFGATFAGHYLSFDEAGYPQRAGAGDCSWGGSRSPRTGRRGRFACRQRRCA